MKLKMPPFMEWIKKISKTHLLIAGLIGILLLVIAIPSEDSKRIGMEADEGQSKAVTAIAEDSQSSYRKGMERQLESMLSTMEGVGKVEVMITLKDEGEAIVEKDVTKTEEQTMEEDGEGTKRSVSTNNFQEETVYVQEDSGNNSPFVAKEVSPEVEGVLVVAQGGDKSVVVKNISDAILALFPVEAHKIKVVKMNQ